MEQQLNKWNEYKEKRLKLMKYGIENNLILPYETKLIKNLRNVYYGGISASIMLLCLRMCQGHCYDRALLLTLGFDEEDEFRMIDADIDGITLNPKYINRKDKDPHYGEHCFIERTKKDGTTWVYDPSLGLVFEKNLYYEIENPVINKINDKQAILDYCEYQDIKKADIERDKYASVMIIPVVEAILATGAQTFEEKIYEKALRNEIEVYKQKINYDELCKEVDEDMKRLGLKRVS